MNLKYDSKRLSVAVKEKRGEIGLRALGKEIGVSAATLSRIENKKEPDVTTLAKVCVWLEIPMEYFFILKSNQK